jgi:hypothetical protein
MDAHSPIHRLREFLQKLRLEGQESVDIDQLLEFLSSIGSSRSLDPELRKLQHESNLAKYKADVDGELEMFRSVIDAAKVALSTSILINGGASVSLLALIGNLAAKAESTFTAVQSTLVVAMAAFAGGVLSGALATGTTYLAQYCYQWEWKRAGAAFHALTILLIVAAYAAFATGIYFAYWSFARPVA